MRAKRILALLLALVLCLSNISGSIMAQAASEFPSAELTEYIDNAGIHWDQLKWEAPNQGKGHSIFGSAANFAVFTLEDFNVINGVEITGKAAVGGVFNNRNAQKPMIQIGRYIGQGNGVDYDYSKNQITTIVGDHLDGYFSGSIYGWMASQNPSKLESKDGSLTYVAFKDYMNGLPGYYLYGDYAAPEGKVSKLIDDYFAAAKLDLPKASQAYLKVLTGTKGTVQMLNNGAYSHQLTLVGKDPVYNVFEVTAAQLNEMRYLFIDIPDDSYAQINVKDSGEVVLQPENSYKKFEKSFKDPWLKDTNVASIIVSDEGYKKVYNEKDSVAECQKIFWNMPNITKIKTLKPFPGTILAPQAHLQMEGINMNGSIIVKSIDCNHGSGEFHYYPFDYSHMPAIITEEDEVEEKTSVSVTKKWVGPAADSAVVNLKNGSKTVDSITLAAPSWSHTFADLPKYDKEGKVISYTVEEEAIPNYVSTVSGTMNGGFTITNTNTEKIDVQVQKNWIGGEATSARKAGIKLLADGIKVRTAELTEANGYKVTFRNLPKYNSKTGAEIKYTVKEKNVPNYTGIVSGNANDGFIVTNIDTEKISVNVHKDWVGGEESNRFAKVTLYADGVEVRSAVLTEPNLDHTFQSLPKYNSKTGAEIQYTVKEDGVPGYKSTVDGSAAEGFTITNTNIEKTSVKVHKNWVGDEGSFITVKLLAQYGTRTPRVVATKVMEKAEGWDYTFQNLPKYAPASAGGAGEKIIYTVQEVGMPGYKAPVISGSAESGFEITNEKLPEPEKLTVKVHKEWIGPAAGSVTIQLTKDGANEGLPQLLNDGNSWSYTFSNLDKGHTYGVKETAIDDQPVENSHYTSRITGDAASGFVILNTNTEKTTVSVEKEWVGPVGAKAVISLYANGVKKETKTLSDGAWSHTFSNLPKYDENTGRKIVYTIEETPVSGYASEITGNAVAGFVVKNRNVETTSVTVNKHWKGGPAAAEATVALLADGVKVEEVTLNASGWSHTFSDLPLYNIQTGEKIVYTVQETPVDGYISHVSGTAETGFDITNTNIEKTEIIVNKEWKKGPAAAEATILLFADGVKIDSKKLTAGDSWTYTFKDLPKYNAATGNEISYKVGEAPLSGYEAEITSSGNRFTVTNTNVEKLSVNVEKRWLGTPAERVTVELFADGVKAGVASVQESEDWKYTFKDLPKYSQTNGELISYTVKETPLAGYESTLSGNMTDGFVFTNRVVPIPETDKISVRIQKRWYGQTGSSATIYLKNGSETVDSVTLNASNWFHTFENLPKIDENGNEIRYEVDEKPMNKYRTDISGNQADGFIISNTYEAEVIPLKISLQVEKQWVGEPGTSATIYVKNGNVTVDHVVLSGNNWKHTFSNLNKFDAEGNEIIYTVEEKPVEGYETVISGNARDGFIVKNIKNPEPVVETVQIKVEKKWIGEAGEQAVICLKNGREMISRVELSGSKWSHVFRELPKYDLSGNEIVYTVEEMPVEGYTSTITGNAADGFVVTNVKNPAPAQEKINIKVEKKWVGEAGEKAVIYLKNGREMVTQVELKGSKWSHVFQNLPKKDTDGNEIVYTVEEKPVEGYKTVISGNMTEGFVVTNKDVRKVTVDIEKKWYGTPKPQAEIDLLQNGKVIGSVTVTEENHWKDKITGLDRYDEDGKLYDYKIQEAKIEGYRTVHLGNAVEGFRSISVELCDVKVQKKWDGPQTDKVTVELVANGTVLDSHELTPEDDWQYVFEDVLKVDENNVPIKYVVREKAVPGYEASVSGNAQDGFVITNKYVNVRDIEVSKAWEGTKGSKAVIHLLADGVEIQKVVLNEGNEWKHLFKDLPVYQKDAQIIYTVKEDAQEGYECRITGNMTQGFTVTNVQLATPQTGDSFPMVGVLLIMALTGSAAIFIYRKRKVC